MKITKCYLHAFFQKRKRLCEKALLRSVPLLIILLSAIKASPQNITINVKQADIETVFNQIKKQSGYTFWYKDDVIKKASKVTINVKNASLEKALNECFQNQPLSYAIEEKTIIVREKANIPSIIKETIRGKIVDEKRMGIPGATIRLKGSDLATVSGTDGNFSIEANAGNILMISYLGYDTMEITVRSFEDIIIELEPVTNRLEQVSIVSTGYQQLPKERATGSFATVNNETFNRRVGSTILDRLEGVTSGLVFNRNYIASDANASPITVRGLSTIFANTRPLIVVDNFPFDGELSNLNPEDIDHITVLKDAAAASIWGARAGNGVIVITTKKGRANQSVSISANINTTITDKPDLFYNPRFLNSPDFIEAEAYLFSKGYFDANLSNTTTRPVISPAVEILAARRSNLITDQEVTEQLNALKAQDLRNDLTKYYYRGAAAQRYALSLNGGSDKLTYYLSSGFDNIDASLKRNSSKRYSLSSIATFTPLAGLEISSAINYSVTSLDNNNTGLEVPGIGRSQYYPYAALADRGADAIALPRDYRLSYINSLSSTSLLDWKYRPLTELDLSDNTTKGIYTRLNAGVKYNFFKGFSAEARYQYERQASNQRNLQRQDSYFTRNLININTQVSGTTVTRPVPIGAILNTNLNELTGNSFRAQLNYYNTIGSNSDLSILAGIDAREVVTDIAGSRLYGYDINTGTYANIDYTTSFVKYSGLANSGRIAGSPKPDKLTDEFFSYFANGSYTFKKRYILSSSARIDQSNLFGVETNQKSVPLWSAGLAWNISGESFYKINILPYLKLRATYGYNGNVDKSVSAFATANFGSTSSVTGAPYATIQLPPNPDLRWERIGIFNLGADFGFKNNIINGSLEFYRKNGKDIIGYAPLDPTSGLTEFKGNVANITGSGIDLELKASPLNQTLKWDAVFLFSRSTDKIVAYNQQSTIGSYLQSADGSLGAGTITPIVGKPVFGLFGYKWAGLDPATGDPQGYMNGQLSKDYTQIANQTNVGEMVYFGSARPTVFGSFRNTFTYKRVSISMNITYKLGYYFRRPTINYSTLASSWSGHEDYNLRWQKPGDEQFTTVPSFTYPLNSARDSFYAYSEVTVEKGDHIRLQDITLGYDLSGIKRLPFRSAQVYGYINNVGILWKATNTELDPDYLLTSYAEPRSFSIGLKLNF